VCSDPRRATLTEEARVLLAAKALAELDRIRREKAERESHERKVAEDITAASAKIALAQQQHLRTKSRLDIERQQQAAPRKETTELLISAPQGFRQQAHVGIDADGQFNVAGIPREWVRVLRMCGLSKRDLRDKEKARVVFGFMADADAALRQHAVDPTRPFDLATPPPPVPVSTEPSTERHQQIAQRAAAAAPRVPPPRPARPTRPSYGPPSRPPRAAPSHFPEHEHPDADQHQHSAPPADGVLRPSRPPPPVPRQLGAPKAEARAHDGGDDDDDDELPPPLPPRQPSPPGPAASATGKQHSLQDAIRKRQLRHVEVEERPTITAQQENVLCSALLKAMAAAGLDSERSRLNSQEEGANDDDNEWSD
jgi:P21-Rho-binding domain